MHRTLLGDFCANVYPFHTVSSTSSIALAESFVPILDRNRCAALIISARFLHIPLRRRARRTTPAAVRWMTVSFPYCGPWMPPTNSQNGIGERNAKKYRTKCQKYYSVGCRCRCRRRLHRETTPRTSIGLFYSSHNDHQLINLFAAEVFKNSLLGLVLPRNIAKFLLLLAILQKKIAQSTT